MSPGTSPGDDGIRWPGLVRGTLVRRYKRFLADVVLDGGEAVTAHCPNTGTMASCCESGRTVYLSRADNPRRKLGYTWEMIEMPGSLVGVNTALPNRLVAHALGWGRIPELAGYRDTRREVPYGGGSRIDLLLTGDGRPPCYVEVKNCTLVRRGLALFPDAVTARGAKHLRELARVVAGGDRGVMFYFVQRMDADRFGPADGIDPGYGAALREAAAVGVEVLAYDVAIDLRGIRLRRRLHVELGDGPGAPV